MEELLKSAGLLLKHKIIDAEEFTKMVIKIENFNNSAQVETPSVGNKKGNEKICEHKRIRENITGGRFDECLDCGKTWG